MTKTVLRTISPDLVSPPPTKRHKADAAPTIHSGANSSFISADGTLPGLKLLMMLCHSPSDVQDYANKCPEVFGAHVQDNTLWAHLCAVRWDKKHVCPDLLSSAQKSMLVDEEPTMERHEAGYWRDQYERVEEDAKRINITCDELRELTFSCRHWFNPPPSIVPKGWYSKIKKGVIPSGLNHSQSDTVKLVPKQEYPLEIRHDQSPHILVYGKLAGHPAGDVDFFLQYNGTVVNIESPRTPNDPFGTLIVTKRLPDFGWEFASDYFVMRTVNPHPGTTIDELWEEYTSNLVEEEVPHDIIEKYPNHPFRFGTGTDARSIPDVPELKRRLPWIPYRDLVDELLGLA